MTRVRKHRKLVNGRWVDVTAHDRAAARSSVPAPPPTSIPSFHSPSHSPDDVDATSSGPMGDLGPGLSAMLAATRQATAERFDTGSLQDRTTAAELFLAGLPSAAGYTTETGGLATPPTAVIFDMDGTLADVSTISHHVSGNQRDFHAFHTESAGVPANREVAEFANTVARMGHAVVVVTARGQKYRPETAWWLAGERVASDALYMRADGDGRKDVDVKRDILTRLARSYRVVLAVDDNPSVINLWSEHAIPTVVVDSDIQADERYR